MRVSNQELFASIMTNHKEKKIVSLCKKLTKKCSFNSGADIENLCRLAYWLFVYDYEGEALSVCSITHDVEFPGKGIWAVWDFIMYMWGLEVHILKQSNNMEKANEIIQKMDKIWKFPPTLPVKVTEHEIERRNRFTVSFCSREKEIANASSETRADAWRFVALFSLIGYGSTGLFPNLNKEKESVDALVEEYIQRLKVTI